MTASQAKRICLETQACAAELIAVLDRYRKMRREYDNVDFYGTVTEQQVTDAGVGVTSTQIKSAVSALEAIEAAVVAGNLDDALYVARN